MENNTLQIEKTKVVDEKNGVVTSMENKLGSLNISLDNNCCIYQVPKFMLKGREYCYQPRVMSIGPVYYKDPKLTTMQEVKWFILNGFLQHPENACPSVNPYINYVREKENEIRGSYQQQIRLSSDEFVEMIVLDAASLIYLFMVYSGDFGDVFHIGDNLPPQTAYSVHDIFQLENQIPYFVLKGIFDIAFGHIYKPITLINATVEFILTLGDGIPGSKAIKRIIDGNNITSEKSIKHLVDLQWMCCSLSLSTPLRNQPNTNKRTSADSSSLVSYIHKAMSFIFPSSLCNTILCRRRHRCHLKIKTGDDQSSTRHLSYTAKQLKDAGVTFVAGDTENPLDVTFANGTLTISQLQIQDYTETILRNLVYFEQCHYAEGSYFIDYIIFLDQLIDTVEDVQVLVKNKIFRNHLGSDDDIVELFNNIGKNVVVSCGNCYFDVSDALNRHASTRRHRWMAILRRKYFNHPWTILSVIAAFMLFVLTLLQTIAAYIYN